MREGPHHFAKRAPARLRAALLGVLLALGATTPAAMPPAEKLLPADTLFVVAVPDCAKLRASLSQSPPGQLWNDAAMKPFHDKFVARFKEEFLTPLERDLGVRLDDYAALPQGQFTFAITQNGWNGENDQQPALLALLDVGDHGSQLKTNLTELRKKWSDAGKPIRTEKIRGVEFLIAPLSSNDVPKTLKQFFPQLQEVHELGKEMPQPAPAQSELVVGQFDSLLIVGSSTKAVEQVVMHLTGGSAPGLADEPAFEANRLALFRDASIYGWLNAKAFFDVLLHAPPEKPNPEAPSPMPDLPANKILSALGLAGLKTAAFDLRAAGEGCWFDLFLGVPEARRQGLFKTLAAETKDANPPTFIPADVVKFQRWRLDGQKAIAALEKMLNDMSPEWLSTWNFLLKNVDAGIQETNPGYDIRKNVLGNLGDDMISYQKAPLGKSRAELDSPPSLFLLGSPNAEQLAAALKGPFLLLSPAGPPDVREFLGRKIYTVAQPSLPFVGALQPKPRKLNYAASDGYVAFSTDVSMLEAFLRSSESQVKALRDTPSLADAAQAVGGAGSGLFGYENLSETMRGLFDSLKNDTGAATNSPPAFNPLTATIPIASPERSIEAWMDTGLLPSFDKVARYFSYYVYSGSANVDGLTYRLFIPVPPQSKK